ncbi:MBL fold metallo-hydrolase [Aliiglaciecola sp. LCG003]|uniref:MBL fold metallo-hydrolase n=1 Tax=Aliiglaciecola sp. LCG003 TaxID=3053655 RepID=UPI00257387B0|nr:MBL fold metallo-hydrolase [Aliiglaciecola sp. LCG003]WJG10797.1 MBL fold metallo-hydrolase [Aliiglaciecola sp. LCG003]
MSKIEIVPFFHQVTNTVTYVLIDLATKHCAIIDAVLDYDPASGRTSTTSADEVIKFVDEHGYHLEWILETHAHADHVTAAHYIQSQIGGSIGIGEKIARVQSTFKQIFNLPEDFKVDGSQFDNLFCDKEVITLGHIDIHVLHTPGHTPACVSYFVEDAVFVGDTMFMPDYGTARADFPNGSAKTLYQSIQRILTLPDTTRVFVGHDYKAENRENYAWETTVLEQRHNNIHIGKGTSQEAFVKMREKRDATLAVPRLILPSIQINIRAGQLPAVESNGHSYLKIPLNVI